MAVFRATRLGQLGQCPADASLAESGNHASIDASLAERVGYKADKGIGSRRLALHHLGTMESR